MKKQTTPDTEWEKELKPRFSTLYDEDQQSVEILQVYFDAYWEKLKPRIHSLLSSRDTYWKERVRNLYFMDFPEIVLTKEECGKRGIETEWDMTVFVKRGELNQALDTLLDNLK